MLVDSLLLLSDVYSCDVSLVFHSLPKSRKMSMTDLGPKPNRVLNSLASDFIIFKLFLSKERIGFAMIGYCLHICLCMPLCRADNLLMCKCVLCIADNLLMCICVLCIADNLLTLLFGGFDTSSITLNYAFYSSQHPSIYIHTRPETYSYAAIKLY